MEKLKEVIVIALATLGVLFIVILLMPDDEEKSEAVSEAVTMQEESEAVSDAVTMQEDSEASAKEDQAKEDDKKEDEENKNIAEVNIPSSDITDVKAKFMSVTLDGKKVTQKIFEDYDLTLVHVWGTFCQPCIEEMGDYAGLYKKLPDNINMVAIVCDVYDGIDSNVSEAKSILKDAGAGFMNIRTSDDVYNITAGLQFVPSSFFVDSEGRIIGEVMDGAGFEDTKKRLKGYMK